MTRPVPPEDERTIQVLRSAMAIQLRDHHLDQAATAAVLDHVDGDQHAPRRRAREYLAIGAACLIVGAAAVGVYVVRGSDSRSGPSIVPPTTSACDGAVVTSALPRWARDGVSADAYVNPHVTGATGDIIGVLFTNPLRSPPAPGTNNKILWVAKQFGAGPLIIRARLEGSSQIVTRTVPGGPGPSIIDMPAPGCWTVTLSWSGHTDTTALPYAS